MCASLRRAQHAAGRRRIASVVRIGNADETDATVATCCGAIATSSCGTVTASRRVAGAASRRLSARSQACIAKARFAKGQRTDEPGVRQR